MRARLVALVFVTAALAADYALASLADYAGWSRSLRDLDGYRLTQMTQPRRPRPPLWTLETLGWEPGSAVSVTRPVDDLGKAEPLSVISPSQPRSKYTAGSAFAIASNGVWLTARHVIDDCRSITVEGGSGGMIQLLVVEIAVHPNADVALLRTAGGARLDVQPLSLAPADASPAEAYHVGFPQGEPGAVYSRYLGRTKMRRLGTPIEDETAVWAVVSSVPATDELSGLSGGAALNPAGAAIGLVSAESLRRGRILTTASAMAWQVIDSANFPVETTPAISEAGLTDASYPPYARDLIRERRVARVICAVKPTAGTRPR